MKYNEGKKDIFLFTIYFIKINYLRKPIKMKSEENLLPKLNWKTLLRPLFTLKLEDLQILISEKKVD
jgi:hypothetical protein